VACTWLNQWATSSHVSSLPEAILCILTHRVQWLAEQSRNWIAPDQLDERIDWALSNPQVRLACHLHHSVQGFVRGCAPSVAVGTLAQWSTSHAPWHSRHRPRGLCFCMSRRADCDTDQTASPCSRWDLRRKLFSQSSSGSSTSRSRRDKPGRQSGSSGSLSKIVLRSRPDEGNNNCRTGRQGTMHSSEVWLS